MGKAVGMMTLLAALLAWVAVDSGTRHSALRTARKAVRVVSEELEARHTIAGIERRLDEEDPEALVLVGFHHASERPIYPRALARALNRTFGTPDREEGLRLLKLAADGGSRNAEWFYWNMAGWPEGEELLERVEAGSTVAAWRLAADLAQEGCTVDDTTLIRLSDAADGLDEPMFGEEGSDARAEIKGQVTAIQTWKAESCEKPTL